MIIPKTLKIGGLVWEVITDNKDFHNGNNTYGYCDMNHHKIFIEPGNSDQMQQEAFIHEIIHACLWNSGIGDRLNRFDNDLNEDITTTLGRQLFQVLKDNNLYFGESV